MSIRRLLFSSLLTFFCISSAGAQTTPAAQELKATIKTTMGDMEVKLFYDKVPQTVSNFVTLARQGFYKNVLVHRVIPGFMIQTGDPQGNGTGGPGYSFADEFRPELKHDKAGILSMANSGKDTNGSQFFITVAPTPHLDGKHTVFGEVTKGVDIAIAMSNVKANATKPEKDIKILSVDVDGSWYKPEEVKKIKTLTEEEIKKMTIDLATTLFKKIGEAQPIYGSFKSIKLEAGRSQDKLIQAYYKADFSQKQGLQIIVVGEMEKGKFVMRQAQFAEPQAQPQAG